MVTPDAPNGKGRSATDNVGVQYGLNALLAGQITPEQFVDLNSKIGGIDIDGNFTPERKTADPAALEILYGTGRMNSGSGAADIPEIDNRTGFQMDDTGFHPAFETFSYRARLDRSNGHHANQIVALAARSVVPSQFDACGSGSTTSRPTRAATRSRSRCARSRPTSSTRAHGGRGPRRHDLQRHVAALRGAADRRGRAAHAGRDEVPDEAALTDYGVIAFTDDQWARLQAAFPTGVCDYTRPGVSQRPPKARWLTFENGPGGQPLGEAPVSKGPAELLDDLTALLASYDLDKQANGKLLRSLEQVDGSCRRSTRGSCATSSPSSWPPRSASPVGA